MEIENSIALRPSFSKDVSRSIDEILKNAAKIEDEVRSDYRIKISDHHIYFFITRAKKSYYSPHLHIELTENDNKTTHVKGLYGPDQMVWTFFMFLHFIIGSLFLIFAVIAYSHWTLKQSTTFDFIIMGLMVVFWFALYFQARINRKKCQPQMHKLDQLMKQIVEF
jgi:hypothetical protein